MQLCYLILMDTYHNSRIKRYAQWHQTNPIERTGSFTLETWLLTMMDLCGTGTREWSDPLVMGAVLQ